MNKRPQDASAEEPDGGNPHIRFRGGPGQGDRPGLLNNQRFSAHDIRIWQRDGAILIPSFFSAVEIDPVAQDFECLFGHGRPASGLPLKWWGEGTPPRPTLEELQRQNELAQSLPFDSSPALNLIGLHPSLINFARAALESRDVRLYQCNVWAKFTGHADYEQPFHMDYFDHTLTVPGEAPAERTILFLIYASAVTDHHGAIHYVSRPEGDEICGILRTEEYPGGIQQAALRKIERSGAGPIGSIFAYATDVYHRATNLTIQNGHRYIVFVAYKAAHNAAAQWSAWPTAFDHRRVQARYANRKDPGESIFEHATAEQLTCLDIPPPGHPFWTKQTLDRAQRRWPMWNLEPWRRMVDATPDDK